MAQLTLGMLCGLVLMERTPLDPESLRLFMHNVVPRLRAAARQAG